MNFESMGQSRFQTLVVEHAITGSIFKTAGGLSYIVAGSNVTVTSSSNGQIVISSVGTVGPSGSIGPQGVQGNPGAALGNNLSFSRLTTAANGTMLSTSSMIVMPDTTSGSFFVYLPTTAVTGTTLFFVGQNVDPTKPFTIIATGSSNIVRLSGQAMLSMSIDANLTSFAMSFDDNHTWEIMYEQVDNPAANVPSMTIAGFSTEFPTTQSKYLPFAQGPVSNLVTTTGSNVLFFDAGLKLNSFGLYVPNGFAVNQSVTGTLQNSGDGATWTDVLNVSGSGTGGAQQIFVEFSSPLTGSWGPLWACKVKSTLTSLNSPIYGFVNKQLT